MNDMAVFNCSLLTCWRSNRCKAGKRILTFHLIVSLCRYTTKRDGLLHSTDTPPRGCNPSSADSTFVHRYSKLQLPSSRSLLSGHCARRTAGKQAIHAVAIPQLICTPLSQQLSSACLSSQKSLKSDEWFLYTATISSFTQQLRISNIPPPPPLPLVRATACQSHESCGPASLQQSC
jgi:hypothetical protein